MSFRPENPRVWATPGEAQTVAADCGQCAAKPDGYKPHDIEAWAEHHVTSTGHQVRLQRQTNYQLAPVRPRA